ncbi:MAG: hypothetical protein BVN34_04810 [Proteobacteria bacterium ST_bin12]|nr:MAG: hypothetical protein BVN34_04810 [Proteobacteria bacterium ST_bin12]
MPGLFDLETPKDLLAKLERELIKLRDEPENVDHAFNFFTTAEHILDWLYPGQGGQAPKQREALKDNEVLLATVSHIANGAKHFDKLNKKHTSVSNTEHKKGLWAKQFWAKNAFAKGVWAEPALLITLSGEAASQFGNNITALVLAEKVYMYWSSPGRIA